MDLYGLYSPVGACMAMYGPVLPRMALCGHVWHCMAPWRWQNLILSMCCFNYFILYDFALALYGSCVALYGQVQSCMVLYDTVWQCIALCGHVWLYGFGNLQLLNVFLLSDYLRFLSGTVWPRSIPVWPCLALYGLVWQRPAPFRIRLACLPAFLFLHCFFC